MKTYLKITLLVAVNLFSCKVNERNIQKKYKKSEITINLKKNNIPASYFNGKVTDLITTEPIIGAIVRLRSMDGTKNYGALTDMDGNFSIKNIDLVAYQLQITSLDYEKVNMTFEIKEHSNCTAEVKLIPAISQVEKPVIYLYPNHKQIIHINLNYAGSLTHTYPQYPNKGWSVTAEPNGTLWDENNQEYYALFWEGKPTKEIIPQDGFVVSGKETATFLEEKLAYLGLNRREANEFIMYWLPRMENNPYNLIHFSSKQYEEQAALEIRPKPETLIRVMMLTQALQSNIKIPLQDLSDLKKTRKGFTVVEWGGSLIHTFKEEL
jgi:uncharacterized protein YdhG (YjbR/CyaY superfamily)